MGREENESLPGTVNVPVMVKGYLQLGTELL